jgi:hypothetical protein
MGVEDLDRDIRGTVMDGAGSGSKTAPIFSETQRLRAWFVYVPPLVVTGYVWYMFVNQVVKGIPQGSHPIPNWLAWVFALVFGFGFPAFLAVLRLLTEVGDGELRIRLIPFRARVIPLKDIESAEVRWYSAMREFGGWGIKVSREGARAYTATGNNGVQLTLVDGRQVLVGSQKSEELEAAVRTGMPKRRVEA